MTESRGAYSNTPLQDHSSGIVPMDTVCELATFHDFSCIVSHCSRLLARSRLAGSSTVMCAELMCSTSRYISIKQYLCRISRHLKC